MKELGDESVHLIVTSPPYWQLKDYGHKGQIGYNNTYEDYINNLNLVWSECYRVLHKGCRLCINIGDQFARSVYYGRYKIIPIRTEIIKFCETIGFDYMGAIIWQKVTTCNTTGGASVMGSFPYPRSGILKIDYEFILIFKKLGNPPKVSKKIKEESKLSQREWNEYFSGHWSFTGEKQNRHLAMFPEELPRRLIKMFSFVGDTVLDPFLGSGTTTLAAKNLKRNSIGYEISAEFLPIIKKKVGIDKFTIFDDAEFQIIKQENLKADFEDQIKGLPYLFKDPLKFDKKIDPRQLKFGSRVDNSDYKKESGYKIKEVVSPEVLILEDGLKVKLIGVKEKKELNGEATNFLQERLKGKRIFMEFDNAKYDTEGNLRCYLYLHNKTFINAHLIKSGLVDVDTSFDYKYKSKFLDLEAQVN
ncbi:MAG: thermonuclease family protein [candidate division Zixibacteria bacterium]|nr:thermonuclease family protein [candidate division Zixibacteria bacterium]